LITPVIHFPGTCLEAIRLYEQAFRASDTEILLYKDAPEDSGMVVTRENAELVMHATLVLRGTRFNMSEAMEDLCAGNMVCFNVFMDSEEEFRHAFDILSRNGKVLQEIGAQFFSKLYIVIVDQYGIRWQIMLSEPGNPE
jgi:PhnB protein